MTEILDPIAIRRDLHDMPELAMKEVRTAAYLADKLEALGYDVERQVGGTTGVIGTLKGAEEGPTLMIRADMDALMVNRVLFTLAVTMLIRPWYWPPRRLWFP